MSADGNSAAQYSFMLSAGSPHKRQLPDLRNLSDHVVRLFFRSDWFLRFELAVEQPNSVHSQFLASSYLAGWAVAYNKDLAGIQPRALLDLAKCCFLRQDVITISEIDFFDGRLAIQRKGLHLCMLDLRLAETDNEVSDAAFG
jgi:hypothetical protein